MVADVLETTMREAGGRIIAALASRYRDLDLAEEALSDACVRALTTWTENGVPANASGWLYQTATRCILDNLRKRRVRSRVALDPPIPEPTAEELMLNDNHLIPDERLRLIFVCCHPAVSADSRAALTLRLVCGFSTDEIARAFLIPETTLMQRLVRAKRKIADAGVSFEIPGPAHWNERLEAVLSTLEVAYSKAYEDASGSGPHAQYATELLKLTRVLTELLPNDSEVFALAALVRYAEARRPARLNELGEMIPLSEQDPTRWDRAGLDAATEYFGRALALGARGPRILQAAIHGAWSDRRSRLDPAPWPLVLAFYDQLLGFRDDAVIRLNRAVSLAEVEGAAAALAEVEALDGDALQNFVPYHAVRADLLRRLERRNEAASAYRKMIELGIPAAEQLWALRQIRQLAS
jgi:RNA polymerase sigma-70 factor (ECF subfamily)